MGINVTPSVMKPVLIETLWNVKRIASVMSSTLWLVLIETLWNVKGLEKFHSAVRSNAY